MITTGDCDVRSLFGVGSRLFDHTHCCASAYESYGSAGEPAFTTDYPADPGRRPGASCLDYIFYSGQTMLLTRLLALPPLSQFKGTDGREGVTGKSCNSVDYNRCYDLCCLLIRMI